MHSIMWWNVCNLFDDHDDPKTSDYVRDRFSYHRDLREIAEIISSLKQRPCLIGLGEVENKRVIDDLINELRWHPKHFDFRCPQYFESKDPRGIDVAYLYHPHAATQIDHVEALYPNHPEAVRPVIKISMRVSGQRLHVAFLHSKSMRSGPIHKRDDTPGSQIRFAYGHLIRKLANDAGASGHGFIAMGDFNDEPKAPSLCFAANAWLGKPADEKHIKVHRLYNLSLDILKDSKGTHCYHGDWSILDQALVNGYLLQGPGLQVLGRIRALNFGPLLYKGVPNRWYSDHLPILMNIGVS